MIWCLRGTKEEDVSQIKAFTKMWWRPEKDREKEGGEGGAVNVTPRWPQLKEETRLLLTFVSPGPDGTWSDDKTHTNILPDWILFFLES